MKDGTTRPCQALMFGNHNAGIGGKRKNYSKIDEAAAVARTAVMGFLNTVKAGDNTETEGGGPAACCVPNAKGRLQIKEAAPRREQRAVGLRPAAPHHT